jgi:tRNA pseudouridine38-40 synthase
MQLWKSILAYDGSSFHGWQVQPGLPTVQGTLASALRHITGETVLPQGSGRTDTGVHALRQVASFALAAPIPAPNLLRALNRALPPAIRVLSVDHAPPRFHARHSARRKTYEYRLFARNHTGHPDRICPPFLAPFVWDLPFPFSLELAQQAAAHILGEHDFTSFAATDPDLTTRTGTPDRDPDPLPLAPYPPRPASLTSSPSDTDQPHSLPSSSPLASNTRTISASTWHIDPHSAAPHPLYIYRVTGSGFLHHMVRNLVGTFTDAAAGRIPPSSIPAILARRSRSAAGPTAPARGLFLVEVEYG